MFESDQASTGLVTVGDLRKKLKNKKISDDVVVHACVDGFTYAPITDMVFEGPQNPDEGEVGVFLLMPDPSSELVRSLPGEGGES